MKSGKIRRFKGYPCKLCQLKIRDIHALEKHVEDHSSSKKKEVLLLGLHLHSMPFSIPRNKNCGKTPGFYSSMPWHKKTHLWPKKMILSLSTQGAAARDLICFKVTLCSKEVTFFNFLASPLWGTQIQTNKQELLKWDWENWGNLEKKEIPFTFTKIITWSEQKMQFQIQRPMWSSKTPRKSW